MRFTARELVGAIPADYLARGKHYFQRGHVLSAELSGGTAVSASVQGNELHPYACQIRLSRRQDRRLLIDGQCSCPIGFNCKHVAAALYAVAEQSEAGGEKGLGPRAQLWLANVKDALEDPNRYPSDVKERLLFSLDVLQYPGGVQISVTPQKARLRKDGSYGRTTPFHVGSYSNARFLRPLDRRLLQMLTHSPYPYRLEDEWGAELLAELVATGHCHWQDNANTPLSMGSPRAGRFAWNTDDEGKQQLQLEIEDEADALMLPLAPPWYLDHERRKTGPIETDLPPRLAAALASAPALDADAALEVAANLQTLPTPKPLPLPSKLAQQERDDIAPTPCLHLASDNSLQELESRLGLAPHGGRDSQATHTAQLEFDYDGLRVAASARKPRLSRQRQGEVWLITRDFEAEARAVAQLKDQGFEAARQRASSYELGNEEAWLNFMRFGLAQLEREGWQIEVDPDFQFRLAQAQEWHADVDEAGQDWFGLDLGVTIDGERQNLLPILIELIQTMPAIFQPQQLERLPDDFAVPLRLEDGRILPLPITRLRPILDTLLELYDPKALSGEHIKLSRFQGAQLAALEEQTSMRWSGGEALRELGAKLRDFAGIEAVTPPKGLQATLRAYQQEGLNWLQFLREFQFSGCLADDMGLGKTLQTLAHLLKEKEDGRADRPSLVVCPTSLLPNWRREAERFAPDLRVLVLHGSQRQALFEQMPSHDLILTSYALLARDQEILAAQEYHLLVLDEAQYIKNPRAKAALAAATLPARQRLCLSGTPLENHLGELWSLFHFLQPGLLGERERFNRLFRTPIEKQQDRRRSAQLKQRVAPFLLRRTKEAVASELPPKTEVIRTVSLSGGQRDLYESVRMAMHERVRQEIANKGWERSQIVVLDALLKLRQICCDPRLVKLEAAERAGPSAKLELLMEMLPELIDEGRRVLLFSQFTSMLSLIEDALKRLKLPYVILTGNTRDRDTPVQRFQNGEVPLFLVSLKAGGTGLNLTAADCVIHYDPWWNPAAERQATDRAHRIGQTKPVFVYKLIAEGTVEEKMSELKAHKQALSDAILSAGASAGGGLSAEDLQRLFEPLS